MIQDMASVQQQEGYFRDLIERLVHQFEGRAHYDDEMAIIREAREALTKTENVSTSGGHVTVGNVAEIREALEDVLFMAEKHAANSPATSAVIFDRDTGKVAREINYLQAIEKARFALGAPARNCDVYQNEDELLRFVCDKLHYEEYSFGWLAARRIIAIIFATEGGRDA